LVLGSTQHPKRVTSYAWASLPTYINFADFDVVIINLAALGELNDPSAVTNVPRAASVGRACCSPRRPEIVVIRDFEERDEVRDWLWSPLQFRTTHAPEHVLREVNSAWAWYFDRVPAYADYFTGHYEAAERADWYFEALSIPADICAVRFTPLAASRDGRAIAVKARFVAGRRHGSEVTEVMKSSRVFVLPTLYGVPASEVTNLILQQRYGLEMTTPPPVWSADYVLPSHAPVLAELADLRNTIANAQAHLSDAEDREAHAARFRGLL
jgi:hypothetical protein